MDRQLFGGDSSEEEEDDSSEESSGEDQQNRESESSSSSSDSNEGDTSQPEDAGSTTAQPPAIALPSSSPEQASPEPTDELTNQDAADITESQMPNTQDLFGDSSSESSSESDDEARSVSPEAPVASPIGSPMEGAESPTYRGVESPMDRGVEFQQGAESSTDGRAGSPIDRAVSPTNGDADFLPLSPPLATPPAENGVPLVVNKQPSQTVEGIFGEDADLSSSDDDMETSEPSREDVVGVATDIGEPGEGGEPMTEQPPEEEFPRINVEIPRCVAHLGSDAHFVKLPNFLSVETRPFDPDLYEDEGEEDDLLLDEEGRARLKLKVENTIRWRYSQDEGGNEIRESNTRVVKWTDGSMSLYLGGEIFDIYKQPLQGEFSHLFVRQGTGLQGQAVFRSKLTFRPHSTDSQTHRKMTLSIADRFSKAQKIRIIPTSGRDPESERTSKIKQEEQKLRASIRRENQKMRVRERSSRGRVTAAYLEPDVEEGEEGYSLSAIKSSVRSRVGRGGGVYGGEGGEGSSSEEDEVGAERLMRAKDTSSPPPQRRDFGAELEDAVPKRLKKGRKLLLSDDEESD